MKLHFDEHPWQLLAFGALAGVWFASHGRARHRGGLVRAVAGGIALRIVRDLALYEMTKIARTCIEVEDATDAPRKRPRAAAEA